MTRKKSGFFTFCFSLLPGAGQMYMGFMKRGISLMSAFFFIIFLSSWLNMGPLMFVMPIVWFFAFFDTHNLRSMPDDEFYALEDDFILIPDFAKSKTKFLHEKYRSIFALILIIIGFSILWNNLYHMLISVVPYYIRDFLYNVGYYFPQFVVGFAIIALGLYLIRGKKKDLEKSENTDMLQDKGGF
jgi:hypothetical protein